MAACCLRSVHPSAWPVFVYIYMLTNFSSLFIQATVFLFGMPYFFGQGFSADLTFDLCDFRPKMTHGTGAWTLTNMFILVFSCDIVYDIVLIYIL